MKSSRLVCLFTFALALLALPAAVVSPTSAAHAQGIRDRYRKIEYRIPMRDGVKLYTAVYVPRTGAPTDLHPIILERTPYGAGQTGEENYPRGFRGSDKMQEQGYIFAYQDVRGKNASEGDYVNVRPQLKGGQKGIDESTDTFDTVDFLVKNVPGNNNKVGLWGISYPGFYAGVGAINTHPSLAAVSPQAPVTDWFIGDDVHHNGAFFLQDTFDFIQFFDVPRPTTPGGVANRPRFERGTDGAYRFFLRAGALSNYDTTLLQGKIPYWNTDLLAHPNYDTYWKDRALQTKMRNVKCAVLTVGGWFDAEDLWGALNLYKFTERQNPNITNVLVMGPWSHGQWASSRGESLGDLLFGQNTATYYEENIEFPFFERYLNNKTDAPVMAEATVFETGGNVWRTFAQWPPATTSLFAYLDANNTLSLASTAPTTNGSDDYLYNPATPTPYIVDWETSRRRPATYMVADQKWAATREDVLTYRSAPLDKDTTVAGVINVEFIAATTGTDADFVVKVCDEYPADAPDKAAGGGTMAGKVIMIRSDILRGRFRDSLEKPAPFVPNKTTKVNFALNDLLHTFKKGHRITVQVQSAWFPLVDRNPNKFVDIYKAKDADFGPATITIFRGAKYPSRLRFGLLSP